MSTSRIEALSKLAEKQPDDPMIHYGLANEFVKLERWDEAVQALEIVVRLNPNFTAAHQMLGSAHLGRGDAENACRVWEQGVKVADEAGAWKAKGHMEGLLSTHRKTP